MSMSIAARLMSTRFSTTRLTPLVVLHDLGPSALGLPDPLDYLANRTTTARLGRHIVCHGPDGADGVADRYRHARDLQGRNVCQVVAHHAGLVRRQAFEAKYLFEHRPLVEPA